MTLDKVRIVLVEPNHPGNIGAVARAMKTMDLHRLTLVRPREFPSYEAERRALEAVDILNQAEVVETLEEAVSDCQLVVGGTARARSYSLPVLDARQTAARLCDSAALGDEVAAVFGPERTGLTNSHLNLCRFELRIPTSDTFRSLNLGSAVQLLAYEVFLANLSDAPRHEREPELPDVQTLEYFYKHLEQALDQHDFILGDKREVAMFKLRRLFGRSEPDVGELKLLHSLANLIERSPKHEREG